MRDFNLHFQHKDSGRGIETIIYAHTGAAGQTTLGLHEHSRCKNKKQTGGPTANMIVYRLRKGFFSSVHSRKIQGVDRAAVWNHRNDGPTPVFSCRQVEAAVGGKGNSFTEIKVGLTYFKNKEDRVQLLPLRFIP